jgi:electron transport complex protein RnfG
VRGTLALIALLAFSAHARVFLTQQQALATAFPGVKVTREVVYLTPEQLAAAKKESGLDFTDRMIVRYASPAGYAYFDTHRVRTLAETVMIVVTPDGRIDRVEILSFDEPPDYLPKPRWIEQFRGRKLDDDLSLKRAIRPISGASLSGRAITNASRKILALHRAIGASANGASAK